jgi:hypothetical protein
VKATLGWRRHVVRLFRLWVRRWLLRKSPYYRPVKRGARLPADTAAARLRA